MTKTVMLTLTSEELRMILCKHFDLDPSQTHDLMLVKAAPAGSEPRVEPLHPNAVSLATKEEMERPWESASREG